MGVGAYFLLYHDSEEWCFGVMCESDVADVEGEGCGQWDWVKRSVVRFCGVWY